MLDSSPVALPRTLKRSASTASLPTPPRTYHKRGRGRSRGSCDSDTESDVDSDGALSSEEDEREGGAHKRRKTEGVDPDEEEDRFWLGAQAQKKGSSSNSTATSSSKTASSSSPAPADTKSLPLKAPLLYRRLQAPQADIVAPVSPPPSHRKTAVAPPTRVFSRPSTPPADSPATVVSSPVTPQPKRPLLFRDSPNNPFLSSDTEDLPSSESPHTPIKERPNLTYVFRGVRRSYKNPLYNHAEDRPFSPSPASNLPIDHPDFSPTVLCPPKLLFPTRRSQRQRERRARLSVSGDEGEGDGEGLKDVRPLKLDFGGKPPVRGESSVRLARMADDEY